ncbi:hypothetical protein F4809DRAFT_229069 [Biscogniauxia mediterranea]|nr:hypothetical protein F4809DRAFT_229069 [Biscogniauxia mediterranea]
MQLTLALSSALLGVALAAPQGVTEKITPTGAAPAGCTGSFDGKFEITVAQITEQKRSIPEKRDTCGSDGVLVLTLEDGSTFDAEGRTGYIASNYQFQFDSPAQAGAIYTSGFSVCENNVLALGSSKTFYRCLSGDFYNLYDRDWAEQCEPVSIIAMPCGSDDSASQVGDGQVVGTTVVQTTIVTALSDGQPQVVTTTVPIPLCQIGDGQVQVVTTPCASVTSVASTSTYVPVSEYTDGQIQVTPPGTATAPAPTTAAPGTTGTAVTSGVTSGASAPAPSSSVVSSGASITSAPSTTSASSPSSATASSPASTSAPPQEGSTSRVTAGSVGALVLGFFVAAICL